jgi:hypothetical protein
MHGTIAGTGNAAITATDRIVENPDKSVCDDESLWFSRAAQVLLQPKPGLVLHLLTDCGERNGDRYASGDVKVPSFIVRQLLRTEHGEAWLNVLMDGCGAPWWQQRREIERDARLFREAISRRG